MMNDLDRTNTTPLSISIENAWGKHYIKLHAVPEDIHKHICQYLNAYVLDKYPAYDDDSIRNGGWDHEHHIPLNWGDITLGRVNMSAPHTPKFGGS